MPRRLTRAAGADPTTPQGRQAAEDEREKQWNQANGGLYETHAARREREAREKREADAAARQQRADADAEAARNQPTVSTRQESRGGKTYTVQTTTPKGGGDPTIKVFGPDGKEVPGGLPDEAGKDTTTTVTRNGKMYAMPVNSGVQALIYNKGVYEKAGLDPAKPPATLSELLETAGKISVGGGGQGSLGGGRKFVSHTV